MSDIETMSRPAEADTIIAGQDDGGTPPPPPDRVGVRDGDGDRYVDDGIRDIEGLLEDEAQIGQGSDAGDGAEEQDRIYEMRTSRRSLPVLGGAAVDGEIQFEGRAATAMPVGREAELGRAAIRNTFSLIYGGRSARRGRIMSAPYVRG